ncbi:MAG: hypothetical protein WCP28_09450 [Actinomycetes bacterium]
MSRVVPYLTALTMTLIIETPIYWYLLTRFAGVRTRQAITAAVVINLVSHPLFTFVFVPLTTALVAPVTAILIGESGVCALEAGLLYAWLRRDAAVVVASVLIANGCSFGIGLILLSLRPW